MILFKLLNLINLDANQYCQKHLKEQSFEISFSSKYFPNFNYFQILIIKLGLSFFLSLLFSEVVIAAGTNNGNIFEDFGSDITTNDNQDPSENDLSQITLSLYQDDDDLFDTIIDTLETANASNSSDRTYSLSFSDHDTSISDLAWMKITVEEKGDTNTGIGRISDKYVDSVADQQGLDILLNGATKGYQIAMDNPHQTIVETASCSDLGGTLSGNNLFTPLDNGTFGSENGNPDQSPGNDPYPGVVSGGNYRQFYDPNFDHGDYSYIANAITPRNSFQHDNITDPVYGVTGRFFASDPDTDTPTLSTTLTGLTPNQFYEYSFWAANSEPNGNPNNINVKINSQEIYSTGPLPAIPEALEWKKHTVSFTNGASNTITIDLESTETGSGGNDFYLDNIELRDCNFVVDYGDAPSSYGDVIHTTIPTSPTVYLGTVAPDGENTTSLGDDNGIGADGDDVNQATNDEDAFSSLSDVSTTGTYSLSDIPVNNTSGNDVMLHAWIDFDRDGKFAVGEYQSTTVGNNVATADLNWIVPNGTTEGTTYARFRITPDTIATDDVSTTDVDERSKDAVINGEVEDYQIAITSGIISVSGTVFEDMNYGGGAGRNFAAAEASAISSGFAVNGTNATGVNNARVELYSYDGTNTNTSEFIEATTTDNDGNYSFNISNGNYLVRVVNNTINSLRPSNFTGETPLAVQTFRNDPDEVNTEIANEVGGINPAVTDSGNVSIVDEPLPTNAQSVTAIDISGNAAKQVDFGFNFDTIVNTNDSGQGSLRQFIFNSNELANSNLAQDLPAAITPPLNKDGIAVTLTDYETSIFMIPDPHNDIRVTEGSGIGQINLSQTPPDGGTGAFVIDTSSSFQPMRMLDFYTSIDGRTQIANIPTVNNTSNLNVGSNETTGAEIIISKSFGGDMIYGQFDNLIFHSLGIVSEGNTNSVGLRLSDNGGDFVQSSNTNNIILDSLTISTSNCGIQGVGMVDSVIRNSVIRDSGANSNCNNIQLRRNSNRNLIENNLILRSSHYGINFVVTENNDNIISGNQIVGNGTANSNNQTSGIGLRHSTNTTIFNNMIHSNVGDGITITNDSTSNIGNLISQNSIYKNGDLGIDLGSGNGGDGLTSNDNGDGDTGANQLQNFPEITNIISDGTSYTIEGTLDSTLNSDFVIELFSNAVCNADINGTAQPDKYGEGEKYHATIPVTTNASGQATFSTTVAIADLAGNVITSTATSTASNNTSELSRCFATTPNLLLVKRITAINPDQSDEIIFTDFVDDSTDEDNNPKWLGSNGIENTYVLGEINGGEVEPNDEVEYTIYFLSDGSETANNVLVCDLIPDHMKFVVDSFNNETPASGASPSVDRGILWEYDGVLESLSNNSDGDAGYYFAPGVDPTTIFPNVQCGNPSQSNTNGAVVINLGNLPGASSPGNPTNSYGLIRFRALVE